MQLTDLELFGYVYLIMICLFAVIVAGIVIADEIIEPILQRIEQAKIARWERPMWRLLGSKYK